MFIFFKVTNPLRLVENAYLVIILYASSIPKVWKGLKAEMVWSFTSAWGCAAPGSPWSSRVEGANS